MADRILLWHIRSHDDLSSLPRFFMDADYEKVALRVYADTAPVTDDLAVDIQADGVSIFNNLPTNTFTTLGHRITIPTTTPILNKGENEETEIQDLNGELIPNSSWVTLVLSELQGAKGITIQLELNRIDQEDS